MSNLCVPAIWLPQERTGALASIEVRGPLSLELAPRERTTYPAFVAHRASTSKSTAARVAIARKPPAKAKSRSRGKALAVLFNKAAQRAVSEHQAQGHSVWGKVHGRLSEVRPGKAK